MRKHKSTMTNVLILSLIVTGISFVRVTFQHFIWPLSWCLLSDLCNHTWIEECGYDALAFERRVFTDACDMMEYNCDHDMDFESIPMKLCLSKEKPPGGCPICPHKVLREDGKDFLDDAHAHQEFRRVADLTARKGKAPKNGRRYTPEALKGFKYRSRRMTTTAPLSDEYIENK